MRKVTLEQYCSKTQRSVIKNVNRPSLHFQKKQTETELTCVGHLQFVLMLNDSEFKPISSCLSQEKRDC